MSVAGIYPGGTRWGVRWTELGQKEAIREYRDEEEARSVYEFLLGRYAELGREDKPELVAARIHWQVQE